MYVFIISIVLHQNIETPSDSFQAQSVFLLCFCSWACAKKKEQFLGVIYPRNEVELPDWCFEDKINCSASLHRWLLLAQSRSAKHSTPVKSEKDVTTFSKCRDYTIWNLKLFTILPEFQPSHTVLALVTRLASSFFCLLQSFYMLSLSSMVYQCLFLPLFLWFWFTSLSQGCATFVLAVILLKRTL